MPAPDDRDILRLVLIVEIAERTQKDLEGVTLAQFEAGRTHIDLAAYRIGSIGEYAGKLSQELKEKYPTIPWARIQGMRNALFHDLPVCSRRCCGKRLVSRSRP